MSSPNKKIISFIGNFATGKSSIIKELVKIIPENNPNIISIDEVRKKLWEDAGKGEWNQNHEDKTYKSEAEIRKLLDDAGISLDKPIVTSCGSGVTACILSLAFERLGAQDTALFDGSWTEWGSREEFPVSTLDDS